MGFRVFLLIFTCAFFAHMPSFAQTSGATAPEVTQFEPVDTTDLVNLATGDFSYSIPVLTVPGAPGGGYPLALSYHSGILYDQEASWVGLGWNLTPGSVSRAVRGFPDDYKNARIDTHTDFKKIYSYSVGISYSNFNAGVNWDNHGGFGGQVGYMFASARYNVSGSGSSSWSLGYGDDYVSMNIGSNGFGASYQGVGVDFEKGAGVGFNLRGQENGPGVSLSSQENGFGIIGSKVNARSSAESQGTGVQTKTASVSLSLAYVSLGYSRTKVWRDEQSNAYGYIHLDKINSINEPNPGVDVNTTLVNNFSTTGDGSDLNHLTERLATFQLDKSLGNSALALDTYFQDYNSGKSDFDDYYHLHKSYNSNYMTGNYDSFTISAQGVSGSAKPVLENRGMLMPSDAVFYKTIDGDPEWRFHPYRNLYWAMEESLTGFPQEHFYENGSWQSVSGGDNMVFLNDSGLIEDNSLIPIEAGDPGTSQFPYQVTNRSKRIRYELDDNDKIERVIVTKPDGMIYVFGVMRDADGLITAGAAPKNYNEQRFTKQSDSPSGSSADHKSRETMNSPYAYSWLLAAVISPDFVDRAPLGKYGPEDYGDFITFHYNMSTPSYRWVTPISQGNPWDDDEGQYTYMGRSIKEKDYYFQRSKGFKEVYVPAFAKTKSHIAVFDLARGAEARMDGLSVEHLTGISATTGQTFGDGSLDYQTFQFIVSDDIQNAQLKSDILALGGTPSKQGEYVLLFPLGTAQRFNLARNESFSYTKTVCVEEDLGTGIIQIQRDTDFTLTYKGTLANSDHEIYYFGHDVPFGPGSDLDLCGGSGQFLEDIQLPLPVNGPNGHNSYARLKSIRLFERHYIDAIVDTQGLPFYDVKHLSNQPSWNNDYLLKTEFIHNYELGANTRNALPQGTEDSGRLTLNQVRFFNRGGVTGNNGYHFDYYKDPNRRYTFYYQKDPWGYYSSQSTATDSIVDHNTLSGAGTGDIEPPIQAVWSLKEIKTPVGSKIDISYEANRYSYVQDRLAVLARSDHFAGEVFETLNRQAVADLLFTSATTNLKDITTLINDISAMTFTLPPSQWTGHVVVNCSHTTSGNPNNHARFVIPLNNTASGFKPGHPAVEELARWLWHEENLTESIVNQITLGSIYGDSNAPTQTSFFNLTSTSEALAGELGGGIRVKQIELSPSVGTPTPEDTYQVTYDYKGPNQLESGVIFTDPPRLAASNQGDRRIVRNESNPYLHFMGGNVNYEFVRVKTVQAGMSTGSTLFRFNTPKTNEVAHPFEPVNGTGSMTSSYANAYATPPVYNPQWDFLTDPVTSVPLPRPNRFFKWKYKKSGSYNWEVADMTSPGSQDLKFTLRSTTKNRLINNSALVGTLAEKSILDEDDNVLSKTITEYEPAFDPILQGSTSPNHITGSVLKRFSLNNNLLAEDAFGTDKYSIKPQGMVTEKSMAMLMASTETGYEYDVKSLMIDEVFNYYKPAKTTVHEYHYRSDSANLILDSELVSSMENLAYDYWTGAPMVVKSETGPSNGNAPTKMYAITIPAHQLYQDQNLGPENMRAMNMLTQPGLKISATLPLSFNDDAVKTGLLDSLTNTSVLIDNAILTHWQRPFSSDPDKNLTWLQDSEFAFVHPTSNKTGTGWKEINLQQGNHFLDLTVNTGNSGDQGTWEAAGQNTLFDDNRNVLEYRTRDDVFSSAVYIHNNRYPGAQFQNAPLAKVYYEGFEDDPSANQNTTWKEADISDFNAYPANFDSVYVGVRSKAESFTLQDWTGTIGPTPVKPGDNRSRWWISFYMKPGSSPTLDGANLNISQRYNPNTETWITPVDFGWYLVRQNRATLPSGVNINAGVGGFIDEITVYPAASNPTGNYIEEPDASVSIFGYHPHTRKVISITDARGRTIRFEYNLKGELFRTYDQEGNLRSEHFRVENGKTPVGDGYGGGQ